MQAPSQAIPVVLITGASSGIGRAIAKVAAAEQRAVVLVGRSLSGLSETAEIVRRAGGDPHVLQLDLLSDGATERIDRFLLENRMLCDVLVNSAGYGLRGAAANLPIERQLGIIDVNIRILTELTLRFLPGMVERKSGGVINLSSVASFTPGPYMSLYYASKGFVRSFSEALYQETRNSGVTVTCVAPGPVKTAFLKRAGADRTSLFRLLPKLDADVVAKRAWNAYRSKRRLVIPGSTAKLAAWGSALLPNWLLIKLVSALQR
jgi:short-subunit dehydrogenase